MTTKRKVNADVEALLASDAEALKVLVKEALEQILEAGMGKAPGAADGVPGRLDACSNRSTGKRVNARGWPPDAEFDAAFEHVGGCATNRPAFASMTAVARSRPTHAHPWSALAAAPVNRSPQRRVSPHRHADSTPAVDAHR